MRVHCIFNSKFCNPHSFFFFCCEKSRSVFLQMASAKNEGEIFRPTEIKKTMGRKADVPHLMQFKVQFSKHNYYLFLEREFVNPVCLVKPQLEDLYAWFFLITTKSRAHLHT